MAAMKYKCTSCGWSGDESKLTEVLVTMAGRTSPSEYELHCPDCNRDTLEDLDDTIECPNCKEITLPEQGGECSHCKQETFF